MAYKPASLGQQPPFWRAFQSWPITIIVPSSEEPVQCLFCLLCVLPASGNQGQLPLVTVELTLARG